MFTFYAYTVVQFKNLLNSWNLYFSQTKSELFKEFTYLKKHNKYKYYNKLINFHITVPRISFFFDFIKTVLFAGFYKVFNFLITQSTIIVLFLNIKIIKQIQFIKML